MTWIDWGAAIIVGFGALTGFWKGAVRQVVSLVSTAAAVAAPWLFAGPVARAAEGPLDAPYPAALLFSSIALALVAWVSTRLIVRSVLSRVVKRVDARDDEASGSLLPSSFDRLGGTLLGASKSGLTTWLLLSVAALVVSGLGARGIGSGGLENSELLRLCTRHNAVGYALDGRMKSISDALNARKERITPNADKALKELLDDRRFQRVTQDSSLIDALGRGDILAVSRSPELLSMLNDGDAMKRVRTVVQGATAAVTDL